MPSRPARPLKRPKPRMHRRRGPNAGWRGRWLRVWRNAPPAGQFVLVLVGAGLLFAALNWTYQAIRKPSELFFPVSAVLYKTPAETWSAYGRAFRRHATEVITPAFLAALAQVEGSGNPVARTRWRWSLQRQPLEMYRPSSSAVGMYQITDGTFAEAKRYCIHAHVVVEAGAWGKSDSCWFNGLYMRTMPSDAIELTSAYLDRNVSNILGRMRITNASMPQKQDLAALIHLCGAGAGELYARRRFRLVPGQRCGDHDARAYLARVKQMKNRFLELQEKDQTRN